jgi:Metal-dependent proteases with possible chaperone activity
MYPQTLSSTRIWNRRLSSEIVSGGHTHLVIVKDYGEFEIIGRTMDDAAGEAFDKVARAVGTWLPGRTEGRQGGQRGKSSCHGISAGKSRRIPV